MSATLRGLGLCIDDLGNTFAATTGFPVALGTIVEGDKGDAYMFVYNTGSTSITQYYGAFATSTATDGIGYVASAGLSGKLYQGAAMTAIDSSNAGWVCVRGYCTAYASAALGTVGWGLCGGTLGVMDCTTAGWPIVAVAVVTSGSAGTGNRVDFRIR
jgi:hypothetical protein